MHFTSSRERRLWGSTGALLALIYGSAFVARSITDFLRDQNLLRITVAALFVFAAVVVVRWVIRSAPGAREFIALAAIARLYHLLLYWTLMPEERIHLLEYGLLAGLIYSALTERQQKASAGASRRASRLPAVGAMIATALCGWIDEVIQFLLPNRYYDIRDIALNAAAGILAVLACTVQGRARSRRLYLLHRADRPAEPRDS